MIFVYENHEVLNQECFPLKVFISFHENYEAETFINFSIIAIGFDKKNGEHCNIYQRKQLTYVFKKITHNESRHRTDARDEGRGENTGKGVTVMERGM